jgi:hypothetical protein
MRQLVLAVALCFVFAVVGYADRCSDLCDKCKRTRSNNVCCLAHRACAGFCKDASEKNCQQSDSNNNNEDDNRRRQPVFAPNFDREVRREIQRDDDRAILNFNQNQIRVGFGVAF